MNLEFPRQIFEKKTQLSIAMKTHPVNPSFSMRADRRANSRREGGVEGISLFPKLCERAYIDDFLARYCEVNGNIIRE